MTDYISITDNPEFDCINISFNIEHDKPFGIGGRMGEVYEEAYMNGYNWDAFLNAYLAANAPELLDGLDADPEGSAYFATYPLTPEYRQKAEKFKQVIVDLIENDSKIFAFLEKHGGEIEWD